MMEQKLNNIRRARISCSMYSTFFEWKLAAPIVFEIPERYFYFPPQIVQLFEFAAWKFVDGEICDDVFIKAVADPEPDNAQR